MNWAAILWASTFAWGALCVLVSPLAEVFVSTRVAERLSAFGILLLGIAFILGVFLLLCGAVVYNR